jgi:hypothetical protein
MLADLEDWPDAPLLLRPNAVAPAQVGATACRALLLRRPHAPATAPHRRPAAPSPALTLPVCAARPVPWAAVL